MQKTKFYKQFDGFTNYYSHDSKVIGLKMNFAAYIPPHKAGEKLPVLYWLSGLTCTEENFITKSYAQLYAAKHRMVVIAPDTSPRGAGVPGETDSYDLGVGAGYYVDATNGAWAKNYKMYSYVTEELRALVEKELPVDPKRSGIFGHSMGGHGAIVLGLRNPDVYKSISAFAPICALSKSEWGQKGLGAYLGQNPAAWAKYDATEIVKAGAPKIPTLIDQGLDDEFLPVLSLDAFESTCKQANFPVTIRRHREYDHSYFFISTFIDSHFAFHAEILKSS